MFLVVLLMKILIPIVILILYSFDDELDYETYANNYFNLAYELEQIIKRRVDLVAQKTLKNPYLIKNINNSKVKLI